jgi:hypothetical protein
MCNRLWIKIRYEIMKKLIVTSMIALAMMISVNFADAAAPPVANGSSVVEPSGCDHGDVSRYGSQLVPGQAIKILNPVSNTFNFFLVIDDGGDLFLASIASGDVFPVNPTGTYSVLGLGTLLNFKQGYNAYPHNYNGGLINP